jgi:lantibiotic modifying enzyme
MSFVEEKLEEFLSASDEVKNAKFDPRFVCLVRAKNHKFKIKTIDANKIGHSKKKRKVVYAFFSTKASFIKSKAEQELSKCNSRMEKKFKRFYLQAKKKYSSIISVLLEPDWQI